MSELFGERPYKSEPLLIVVIKAIIWLPFVILYMEGKLGCEMWLELKTRYRELRATRDAGRKA